MKKILFCLGFLILWFSAVCTAAEVPWQLDKWRQAPEVFPADPALFDFAIPENVQPIFYTGADYQGRETRVFAWLGVPETAGDEKLPAMVLVHGGGGSAFAEWTAYWNRRGIRCDCHGPLQLHPDFRF